MATIFEDNFNAYNDGDLVGQGGWVDVVRGTDFDVQGTTVYEGAKAVYVKSVTGAYATIRKIGNATVAGQQAFYIYPIAGISNNWTFLSDTPIRLFDIGWDTTNFTLRGETDPLQSEAIGSVNLNEWNLIEIVWYADDTVKARANGGSWSSLLDFDNAGDPDRIEIECEQANAEFYFDYIAESSLPVIEPPAMNLDIEMGVPTVTPSLIIEPPAFNLDIQFPIPTLDLQTIIQPPAFNLDIELPVPTLDLLTAVEPPAFNLNIQMGILALDLLSPYPRPKSIKYPPVKGISYPHAKNIKYPQVKKYS